MSVYMKIDGLDGNVTAKGLEKTIEVISANFSVKRNMTSKPGAVMDREGTKPALSEFTVTKEVDSTSPKLFGNATVGTVIPSVTISFVNTGKDLSEYHSIIMKNVLVSGYELVHDAAHSVDVNNTKPMERISFNYTNIEVKNTPHSKDHKAGSPVAVGYNLGTAQAA
jgi:type VI secretion system secreted protein Hcp